MNKKSTHIITAYCWQSGEIGFTTPVRRPKPPEGTIAFLRGPANIVKDTLSALARHAYDGKTLLVPGLPEISLTQKDPVQVLKSFRQWCAKRSKSLQSI